MRVMCLVFAKRTARVASNFLKHTNFMTHTWTIRPSWQRQSRGKVYRITYMTHSDKRVTKSLERSRDNWREHHLARGHFIHVLFLTLFHIVGSLFYHILNSHNPVWPIHDFQTHFNLQRPTVTETVSILSAPCSRDSHCTTSCVYHYWQTIN